MGEKNMAGVPLEGFAAVARNAAAEGMVLLKNENQILPFGRGETVAVFGRTQIDYYRSGTGSGGAVNVEYTVNILEGLRRQETVVIDEELAGIYENWRKEHPFDNGGGGWAAEPWHQEEMKLSEELLCSVSQRNEKALVVIGRTAGEDQDNSDEEGSYRLTEDEREILKGVCGHFKRVAVLLNVPNIIDMRWIEEEELAGSLEGILYIWQGGMEGGNAVADVLCGTVTPSGKLTDTIACCIEDYPSTRNYGDEIRNYYEEDIYVGYRYFETFARERVMFPFGYGLSYTTFAIEQRKCHYEEGKLIIAEVSVKNTGAFPGKEIVQIYVQAPQGSLGKPSRVLAGFKKTEYLQPGEEEIIAIEIPLSRFASYDDKGTTGKPESWILEPGKYRFYMGNSCRAEEVLKFETDDFLELKELLVLEQLEEALKPDRVFQRIIPGEEKEDGSFTVAYEAVPIRTVNLEKRILDDLPEEIPYTGDRKLMLRDVWKGKATLDEFVGQMSREDLAAIVRGEGMSSPKVTPGTAAAFGGVGDHLLDMGIPVGCAADGPSGIRMEGGRKATQLPIGTLLAATWNVELVEKLYEWEGREMVRNRVDTLLGPGMNIRRNPLNGRNFEYYSEDPLITGCMGAAVVRGIRKGGAAATLKHFACNNQEKARAMVDSTVSERALREIYLKGFEIAVKEGKATSVMSSYNPVNGYWAASNYDLLTTILRKDWGYQGIVMTDWWAKMNHVVKGGPATVKQTGSMVRAQNDLYMVVSNNGAEVNAGGDDTLVSLETGELTIGELQRCAKNICRFMIDTPALREERKIASIEREIEQEAEGENAVLLKDTLRLFLPAEERMNDNANGRKAGLCFEVREEGTFEVFAYCMCRGNNQMQTACRILFNRQEAAMILTNGTSGKYILQKMLKVHLKTGYYYVELEIIKPGIQVNWLELVRKHRQK